MTQPPAPEAAVPTCYRHNERETWVRCTRCERPICPDCMTAASVGFQCPECVREGARTSRQPRTVFGGRLSSETAAVTRLIIGLNVVIYLLQVADPGITRRFALLGCWPAPGACTHGVAAGEYYRLITAAFLHAGLLHIFFNMYALLIVGAQLEAVFGRARFATLYLLSALGGSALSYLVSPPTSLGVGASGAVFGLFAAAFVVARRLDGDARGIALVLGINLVIGFVVPGIDWRAHVGGLLTGGVLALAYAYAPRHARASVAIGASLLVGGGAVLLAGLRTVALA